MWLVSLFFAEGIGVVLQSLRPNIHMSLGIRWVNSKAAAMTTPSIPQQHECLLNLVQQPFVLTHPGELRGRWSLSESIAVSQRESVRSRVRGFLPKAQNVSPFAFFFFLQRRGLMLPGFDSNTCESIPLPVRTTCRRRAEEY